MSQPLRVLALVTDAFGGYGGIAHYNREILTALVEMNLASSMTILPRHRDGPAAPPRGISQRQPRQGRLAYSLAAMAEALRRPADLMFCGHLYMAPLAALLARIKGAKLAVQMHGIEAWPRPPRLQRAAVDRADLVLCVSRDTRAAVLGWSSIAPERAVIVSNTVGGEFRPGDGSAMRQKCDVAGKRVLLTVGRLDTRERYKGHGRVIAAIPELVRAGHDLAYLIAGDGDDRPRLEALARQAGVADRVRFLGRVAQEQLVDLYRAAHLFVMPSTGEGFGIAFLEAMACGTRSVGLSAGGVHDAFGDGELGCVVQPQELTATLLRLLDQPAPDREALSAAVHARFGRRAFCMQVKSALGRLSENRS